jgi:hypothetical protein
MKIRKVAVSIDKTMIEGVKILTQPWVLASSAALMANPYVGVYQHDLSAIVDEYCKGLANLLLDEIRKSTGWNLLECESIGKAAGIGLDGELEHGSAIIHHRKFGNAGREAVNGMAPLVGAELRIPPGAVLWIPLKHKDDHLIRSHHMTTSIGILDGPRADEIMVALAIARSGRPLARIGNPQQDKV